MFSPVIIISVIVLIIFFIILGSSIKTGKTVRRNIPRKDETIFSQDEMILTKDKTIFSSHEKFPKKTSTMALCKSCMGTKRIKCKLCQGFGSIRTTRFGPPTTIQIPKVRTVFDAKGRATYQHFTQTQVKPGKIEYINQSCGRCLGSGKIKCPDC